jgi:hypothetical protein
VELGASHLLIPCKVEPPPALCSIVPHITLICTFASCELLLYLFSQLAQCAWVPSLVRRDMASDVDLDGVWLLYTGSSGGRPRAIGLTIPVDTAFYSPGAFLAGF